MPKQTSSCWIVVPDDQKVLLVHDADGQAVVQTVTSQDGLPIASTVADEMISLGYHGEPILLALCSYDVLSVSLPAHLDLSQSKSGEESLLYELEEYVPLPAEEFTADFSLHGQNRMAALVQTQRWKPILDEWEKIGMVIPMIVPLSELIAASFLADEQKGSFTVFLWSAGNVIPCGDSSIEIFLVSSEGKPIAWRLTDGKPENICREMNLILQLFPDHDPITWTFGLTEEQVRVLTALPRIQKTLHENEIALGIEAIMYAGRERLLGRTEPWWNLRKSALAMKNTRRLMAKSVRRLLWSGVLLITALCLFCGAHLYRLQRVTTEYQAGQKRFFDEALPDQNLTTGYRNRLESEYKKMSAQREHLLDLPERISVLLPLFHLLESLPEEPRHRFPEIRLEQDQIRLDGELQTHADAETIATLLERSGFQVEPPTTRQLQNGGVSVRLALRWRKQEEKGDTP